MALCVAKSVKGKEFLYSAKSAHSVPKASSKIICSILNKVKYQLSDNEVWFIHEIDKYDSAFDYASFQRFSIRNGIVKERRI